MELYLILFIVALLGYSVYSRMKVYIYGLLCLMCFIIGFRGMSVGTDTYGYSQTFKHLTLNSNTWDYHVIFDPGFAYLCYLFKVFVSKNPLDCWGLMGVFYVLSYYFFAKKYSGNVGLALVLFIMYDSYFIGFNIIRQCFALSCVMCVCTYFDLNRLTLGDRLKCLLLIVSISYLFHPTMLLFCLIPFMTCSAFMKFVNKSILLVIVVGTLLVNISGFAVNYALSFLNSTGIDGKFINYISHVYNDESGYSILKLILINSFLVFSIIMARRVKNIFLLTGVLGIVVLNLIGPVVIEMVRVYESLMVFCLIFYTQLTCKARYIAISKLYYPALMCVMIVLCVNYLIKGYGEIVPFIFRFKFPL